MAKPVRNKCSIETCTCAAPTVKRLQYFNLSPSLRYKQTVASHCVTLSVCIATSLVTPSSVPAAVLQSINAKIESNQDKIEPLCNWACKAELTAREFAGLCFYTLQCPQVCKSRLAAAIRQCNSDRPPHPSAVPAFLPARALSQRCLAWQMRTPNSL